jgi:arsenate reductase
MNKMRILFLCTHNSVRSQIAEGLLRHLYGDKYEVFSAGTNPAKINPLAIKVMEEIGIDISSQYSKNIDQFSDIDVDLAVTVCRSSSKTICPLCSSPTIMGRPEIVYAKLHKTKHYLLHGFKDPSEVEGTEDKKLVAFRRTRDEIKEWIINQFANLKIEDLDNNKLSA